MLFNDTFIGSDYRPVTSVWQEDNYWIVNDLEYSDRDVMRLEELRKTTKASLEIFCLPAEIRDRRLLNTDCTLLSQLSGALHV